MVFYNGGYSSLSKITFKELLRSIKKNKIRWLLKKGDNFMKDDTSMKTY